MSEPTGIEDQGRSVQVSPSGTAMGAATLRALAVHEERDEVRGPDHLAEVFLAEDRRAPLRDPAVRKWVMKNRVAPGLYEFMIARTAFFDQVVRDALAEHVPQWVLLGAGYDSRPYRFSELAGNTRIFELDAAPTQAHKREVLGREGVAVPRNLAYVPIDFVADDLGGVLLEAGFSRDERALFVWEGVTYYLSSEAVNRTLEGVRAVAPAGSSICFDFASLSFEAFSDEGVKKLRQLMRSNHPGEPTRFGIPKGKLDAFLAERGYAVLESLGPPEMEARYLRLRDGSTIGKPLLLFSLVHAVLHG